MNTSELALNILSNLGGIDNIEQMTNCETRIRVTLIDSQKADIEKLKNIDGIVGIVPFGSQIQVVLGPNTKTISNIFYDDLKIKNANK